MPPAASTAEGIGRIDPVRAVREFTMAKSTEVQPHEYRTSVGAVAVVGIGRAVPGCAVRRGRSQWGARVAGVRPPLKGRPRAAAVAGNPGATTRYVVRRHGELSRLGPERFRVV